MIVTKRGRGRPKKMNPMRSEKETAARELFSAMESYEYKYDDRIEEMVQQRSTRRNAEVFESMLLESPIFEENTKRLKELATKYFEYFYIDELPREIAVEVCAAKGLDTSLANLSEMDLENDDSDENRQIIEDLAYKRKDRREYLERKPPIKSFVDNSFEELPDEKKNILIEHWDEIFNDNVTYQQQVECVIRLIFDPSKKINTGHTAIGKLFGVSKGTISTHYKRMQLGRKPYIGRPGVLNDFEIEQLILFIKERTENHRSPNVFQCIDFIFDRFHISINPKTLYGIIERIKCIKSVKGIPLESSRSDVPTQVVINYYERLDELLLKESIPPEFFFNVDEAGFQDYADARCQIVIVPDDAPDTVYYSIERNSKRATLIGCICMDGSALKPLVVTPQKTVTRKLYINGYNESNCIIVSQEHGFINSEIFAYWADHVFFPELARKREKFNYHGLAVLTMDGCTAHNSEYFLDECTFRDTYPFFEEPGTSDQVQALDLGIFGVQKQIKTHYNGAVQLGMTENNIVGVVNSWMQATTPSNVISAFNQAGVFVESNDELTRVRADWRKGRAVRGIENVPCENIISGRKTLPLPVF